MDRAITLREKRMEILRELNSIEEQITGSSKSRVQKSLEELDSLVFKADPKVGDTKMVFGNQMKWTGSKWEKEGGAGEEEPEEKKDIDSMDKSEIKDELVDYGYTEDMLNASDSWAEDLADEREMEADIEGGAGEEEAPEEEMGVEDQAFVDETISNLESMGFDKEDYNTLLNAGFTPEDIADMDENEVDEAVQEMDKAEAGRAEEAQDMMDIGIELVESGDITQEELMEMDPSELEDRIREKMGEEGYEDNIKTDTSAVDEDAATILELEGGRDEIEGTLEEGGYSPSDLKKMSTSELLTIASEEGFVREDVVNMVNDLSGYEPGTEEFDDALTVWGTDLGMSDEEISNIGSKFGHEW